MILRKTLSNQDYLLKILKKVLYNLDINHG